MLGSPLLGTAVGLVLLFAATALLCSGVTETLSNILQLRAKYLLTGMRAMLDVPERASGEGDGLVAGTRKVVRAAREGARVARTAGERGRTIAPAAPRAPSPAAAPSPSTAAVPSPPPTGASSPSPAPAAAASPSPAPAGASAPAPAKVPVRVTAKAATRAARLAAGKHQRNALHEQVKHPLTTRMAAREVRRMLTDGGPVPRIPSSPMTTALWDSPLLTSLQSRRVGGWWTGTLRNPQYVSGRTFARALVDLLVPTTPDAAAPAVVTIGRIQHSVEMMSPDLPLRRPLLTFLSRAGTDVEAFEHAVEQWYDEQMGKIAGWYKRWARVVLGIVGFVVAVLVNVDTVQLSHALYVEAPLQQAVIATANAGTLCRDETTAEQRTQCATEELAGLQASGLPFGYAAACSPGLHMAACWQWSDGAARHWWDFPLKLAGWVITAFAVSFGAPFWFEALSRLGSLRNTGTKPAT